MLPRGKFDSCMTFPSSPKLSSNGAGPLSFLFITVYPTPFRDLARNRKPGNIRVKVNAPCPTSQVRPTLGTSVAMAPHCIPRREGSPTLAPPLRDASTRDARRRALFPEITVVVSGAAVSAAAVVPAELLRVQRLRRDRAGPVFRPPCRMEIIRSSACPPCTSPRPHAPLTRPFRPGPRPAGLLGGAWG